jgi:hypothetical protein
VVSFAAAGKLAQTRSLATRFSAAFGSVGISLSYVVTIASTTGVGVWRRRPWVLVDPTWPGACLTDVVRVNGLL